MTIATQDTGATTSTDSGVFDAADAFLARIEGANKPPVETEEIKEAEEEETHEEAEAEETEGQGEETPTEGEEEEGEGSEETEETTEEEEPSKTKEASDDVVVKIKVDGKEHEVPVKDLKRLFGQEQSLTRKSQEVADQRKALEEAGAKQTVALQSMLQRAQERAKPFAQLDFLALAKDPNISAEELTALRVEAQRAFDDVQFYGQELDNTYQQAQAQRQQTLKQQAVEAHKVLSDPKSGINGWSQAVYNDIRHFAISQGLNADVVNELTDPAAIKLLHKAMQFDKGQKALSSTTKVVKTPKKILKSSSVETSSKSKPNQTTKAREVLAKSGTVDAAADFFLARMAG